MRKEFVYGNLKVSLERFDGADDEYFVDKDARSGEQWRNITGFWIPRAALVEWFGEDAVKRLEADAHEA
jgi:hypothetical protein